MLDLIYVSKQIHARMREDHSLRIESGEVLNRCRIVEVVTDLLAVEIGLTDEQIRPLTLAPRFPGFNARFELPEVLHRENRSCGQKCNSLESCREIRRTMT